MEKVNSAFDFFKACASGVSSGRTAIKTKLKDAYEICNFLRSKTAEWIVTWMLYVSVVFESTSLIGGKWRLLSWSPGITIAVILFGWVNHHVENAFLISLPISIIVAVPTNILIYKSNYCRAIYFLTIYDLALRVLRMYFVEFALHFSPFRFLIQNVNMFLNAYDCTSNRVSDLGKNASSQVTAQAASVASSFLNSINNVTTEVRDLVSPTIDSLNDVLNSTSSIFKYISDSNEKCRQNMVSIKGDCHKVTMEAMTCKNNYGILSFLCGYISPISVACDKLQKGEICEVFSVGNHFNEGLDTVHTSLSAVNNELVVDLGLEYVANTTTVNFFSDIKNDLKDDINDTFGIAWYWYQGFGYLFGWTIFYLVYKKAVILNQYLRSGKLQSDLVSKILLYANPFLFQFVFTCLNALADALVHLLYEWHRNKLSERNFVFNFNFFATVVFNNGGTIAALIAKLFEDSLLNFEPISISENLGECYKNDLSSPAYCLYFLSYAICYIGYRSYNISGLHKRQQELIIHIAYARWGDNSESIMNRISFLFSCETIRNDHDQYKYSVNEQNYNDNKV